MKLHQIVNEIETEKEELFTKYVMYSREAILHRRKQQYEQAQKAENIANDYLCQCEGMTKALRHFHNLPWMQVVKTELYGTEGED